MQIKVKNFISVVFLNDYRKLIYDHGLHYVSFPLIALGIEFLGACLDQHDFSKRNLSGPRFRKAIKELFPPQYHPFSDNPRCPYYLHNNLRNTFAHQFRPGPRLGLTHRDESIKEGTRHLQIHNGRLTLVSEELYEDFENACKEIIRRIDNNSIGHPKVYDDYLLILQVNEIENDLELQRVLWACYTYWQGEALPPHERTICYSWIIGPYKNRFDTKFHQSKLSRLAKLGFLKKGDTARSGNRRYYKIADPNQVEDLLRKWNLI